MADAGFQDHQPSQGFDKLPLLIKQSSGIRLHRALLREYAPILNQPLVHLWAFGGRVDGRGASSFRQGSDSGRSNPVCRESEILAWETDASGLSGPESTPQHVISQSVQDHAYQSGASFGWLDGR